MNSNHVVQLLGLIWWGTIIVIGVLAALGYTEKKDK